MRLFRILIPAIWGVAAASAQTQIGGPITALIYDAPTRSIRPIQGVPGAAMLGSGIAGDLDWADAAPNGKWAIAARGGALILLAGLDTGDVTAAPLLDAVSADLISWSADSTAAALYSRDRRQLLFASGLNGAPSVRPLHISLLSGEIQFVLADGATQTVLIGIEGPGAGVYRIGNTDARLLARLDSPRRAAFIRNNADIAIVDAATRRIFELRDFRGAADLVPFADLPEGADPLAVGSSASRLYVADRKASSVLVFDLETRQLTSQVAVDTPPALLKATRNSSTFLVGDGAGSLFLLDGAQDATVYFVPKGKAD